MIGSCIFSLSTLILFVLNPFPEKGTQKRITFQMKASGIQAGRNPEEKERALAVVTDESERERGSEGVREE